jgi:hypothetical protein
VAWRRTAIHESVSNLIIQQRRRHCWYRHSTLAKELVTGTAPHRSCVHETILSNKGRKTHRHLQTRPRYNDRAHVKLHHEWWSVALTLDDILVGLYHIGARCVLVMMPTTLSLTAVIAACSVVAGAGARHGEAETWTRGANAVLQVDLTSFNQSVTVGEMHGSSQKLHAPHHAVHITSRQVPRSRRMSLMHT